MKKILKALSLLTVLSCNSNVDICRDKKELEEDVIEVEVVDDEKELGKDFIEAENEFKGLVALSDLNTETLKNWFSLKKRRITNGTIKFAFSQDKNLNRTIFLDFFRDYIFHEIYSCRFDEGKERWNDWLKFLSTQGELDSAGSSLLHWAVLFGDLSMIESFYENVGNVCVKNKDGETPLHWAVLKSDVNMVDLLLKKCNKNNSVNTKDKKGNTPLHYAALLSEDLVSLLLEMEDITPNVRNDEGMLPLHFAVLSGNPKIVDTFLGVKNIVVNSYNKYGCTPGMLALAKKNLDIAVKFLGERNEFCLHWAVVENDMSKVWDLLRGKSNINRFDNLGFTPLFWSIIQDKPDMFNFLINNGASLNVLDKDGNTPLHWAALLNNPRIVKFLIEKSYTQIEVENAFGETPLDWAIEDGEIYKTLSRKRPLNDEGGCVKKMVDVIVDSDDEVFF